MKPTDAFGCKVSVALDGSGPLATGPTFTDVTSHVLEWGISRGVSDLLQPYQAGTARFVIDDSAGAGAGDYDPGNGAGAYSGNIGENVQVLIQATPDATELDLFRGYVDTWEVADRLPALSEVAVGCSDIFKLLGGWSGELSSPGATTTSTRATRVLDDVGVPGAWQDVNTPGQINLIARSSVVNALAELQLCAASEAPYAAVFVTRAGAVRFDPKNQIAVNTQITDVQATLSQLDADLPGSATKIDRLHRGFYRMQRTRAAAITSDGTVLERDTGVTLGVETYEPDYSQVVGDADADGNLEAAMVMFGARRYGPRRLTFSLLATGAQAEAVMGLELRDRVRVKGTSPQGVSIDEECFVIGIELAGDRAGNLRGSLTVVSADFYDDLGPDEWLILDDVTRGLLNTGKLGY